MYNVANIVSGCSACRTYCPQLMLYQVAASSISGYLVPTRRHNSRRFHESRGKLGPSRSDSGVYEEGSTGFSWLIGSRGSINDNNILSIVHKAVQRIKVSGPPPVSATDPQLIVFATPKLLHLLQDEGKLLRPLAQQALVASKEAQNSNSDIRILVGLVDRLPLPESSFPRDLNSGGRSDDREGASHVSGVEGLSISNSFKVFSPLDHAYSRSPLLQPGSVGFFPRERSDLARQGLQTSTFQAISIKLAKAHMLTGRPHLLREQVWSKGSDSQPQKTEDLEIEQASLMLHGSAGDGTSNNFLGEALRIYDQNSMPLTPPRKIHSAFGNVISTLEQDDSNVGDVGSGGGKTTVVPASREIESLMPSILPKFTARPEIWALVLPANAQLDGHFLQVSQNYWQLFEAGARLHRVSGGGGGWDGPGGPVSLEVSEHALSSSSSSSSFSSSKATDDTADEPEPFPDFMTMSAVRKGEHVVFLAAGVRREVNGEAGADGPMMREGHSFNKFASIPDDGGLDAIEPQFEQEVYPDFFGALTQKMTLLAGPGDGNSTAARHIDLPPYSVVQYHERIDRGGRK